MGGRAEARELKAWLFKGDPGSFAWRDLLASPGRTARWDGIRNYQVRNMIRDAMGPGDRVLFCHSGADAAVLGTAEVVGRGASDPTQFGARDPHRDAKADPRDPRWHAIDIRAGQELPHPVTPAAMRTCSAPAGLALLRKGRASPCFPWRARSSTRSSAWQPRAGLLDRPGAARRRPRVEEILRRLGRAIATWEGTATHRPLPRQAGKRVSGRGMGARGRPHGEVPRDGVEKGAFLAKGLSDRVDTHGARCFRSASRSARG
ncbi:MAG: EVE domain-containing protein [Planctomycetaceae bacterium]